MGSLRTRADIKAVEGNAMGGKAKTKAPEQTFEEVKYLKYLIDHEIPVRIRLSDNEEIAGLVEFYDANFLRITRENMPNLFVFKHDIKYLYEEPGHDEDAGQDS
jgi:sRNA-binding regulator protein Hfq